jgi:hypothetical protein
MPICRFNGHTTCIPCLYMCGYLYQRDKSSRRVRDIHSGRCRSDMQGRACTTRYMHAPNYSPLPNSTNAILTCPILTYSLYARTAGDVISFRDVSAFLDLRVSMDVAEVPTKRFTFRCSRPTENRRPIRDPLIVSMMSRWAEGYIYLPHDNAECLIQWPTPISD